MAVTGLPPQRERGATDRHLIKTMAVTAAFETAPRFTCGEVRGAKIVTGVDDHSRFCVMAAVVERATARAVCVAFAQALARYGAPEEVITDIHCGCRLDRPGVVQLAA